MVYFIAESKFLYRRDLQSLLGKRAIWGEKNYMGFKFSCTKTYLLNNFGSTLISSQSLENATCHSSKPICLHSHCFSYLNPTSLTMALPTTFLAVFPHWTPAF